MKSTESPEKAFYRRGDPELRAALTFVTVRTAGVIQSRMKTPLRSGLVSCLSLAIFSSVVALHVVAQESISIVSPNAAYQSVDGPNRTTIFRTTLSLNFQQLIHIQASNIVSTSGWYDVDAAGSELVLQVQIFIPPEPPCTPHKATAVAQVVNGFVVGASVTDPGCGYTNTPMLVIRGGGGTNATATAVLTNGTVAAINIMNAGCCYTNTPQIIIASPSSRRRHLSRK